MGHVLGMPPQDLVSLGDWQDRSLAGEQLQGTMPLRYSAQRYQLSLRNKLILLEMAKHLPDEWEGLQVSELRNRYAEVQKDVDLLARIDAAESLWRHPVLNVEKRAFKIKRKTRQLLMPSIPGKITTGFLRNGDKLCCLFQNRTCSKQAEMECSSVNTAAL